MSPGATVQNLIFLVGGQGNKLYGLQKLQSQVNLLLPYFNVNRSPEAVKEAVPVLLAEGRNVRNEKCSKEVTVEGCDTVLLGWSFSPQHNKCVKGFSCSDIANRFENEWQCKETCPPVSGRRPEIKVLVMWSCPVLAQVWRSLSNALV
ncbi:hypothetical protein MTO96_034280 [Rhipicephalus appendiculatus]